MTAPNHNWRKFKNAFMQTLTFVCAILVITPLCPHSLSFRPIVLGADSVVNTLATRVNEGTMLICDGQCGTKLNSGERIIIRRSPDDVLLIENPDARKLHILAEKLSWGISPTYQK